MADINNSAVTTGTTPSLTSDYAFVSISGAVRRMSLALVGQVIGFIQGGTSPTTRRMQDKIREAHVSPMDFGATRGTTTAPSTASDTAFANALAWCADNNSLNNTLDIPTGYFRLNNPLDLPPDVKLRGKGRNNTHLYCYSTTVSNGGLITLGASIPDHNVDSVYYLEAIHFFYAGTGTATTLHGMRVTHRVLLENVYMDNFPGYGFYFDTSWASPPTGTPQDYGVTGAKFVDCWAMNNTNGGCYVRYAARGCIFFNCQFDRTGSGTGIGFRQADDGGVSEGHLILAGQASYNTSYGYQFLSGSNIQMYGTYAEYNMAASVSDTTYSHANEATQGPTDFYFGDNLTNCWFNIGVLLNQDTDHVRLPSSTWNNTTGVWSVAWGLSTGGQTATVQIWEGGRRGYGAT